MPKAYHEPAFDDSTPSDEIQVRIDGLIPHPTAPGLFTLRGCRVEPFDLTPMIDALHRACTFAPWEIDAAVDAAARAVQRERLSRLLAERMEVLR